jgi:hypothetical protein
MEWIQGGFDRLRCRRRDLANDSANGTGGTGRDRWSGWNVWDEPQALFAGLMPRLTHLDRDLVTS